MATLSISSMTTLTGSGNNNNCVLPILDLQTTTVANQNEKLKISSHYQFFTNNTTVGGLSSYNNYFGTGVDGDMTVSSSAQISSSNSPAGLNNTLHGDVIVKNYKNLTINSGILFSPLKPCRGLLIYCTGDLTVNGTISMTGKGGGVGNKIASPLGIAKNTDARYDLVDASIHVNNLSSSALGGRGIPSHWNWAPSGSVWFNNYKIRIPLSGSVAGGTASPATGNAGSAGISTGGGGGSGGGISGGSTFTGGAGGRGTVFIGGGGGGGGSGLGAGSSGRFEVGGAGSTTSDPGSGGYGYGGGGAGTPAGTSGGPVSSAPINPVGAAGAGGLLIIIVRGNITINSSGIISSNGANGGPGSGNGSPNPTFHRGSGGGGGGGGVVYLLYGGTYTNAGSVTTSGGSGGAAGASGASVTYAGGAGGAGSTRVKKIHT